MWGAFCRYFGPFKTAQDPPDVENLPQLTVETMTINKDWLEWYCKNSDCSESVAYKIGARMLVAGIYTEEELWGITILPRSKTDPYLVRVYRLPPTSNPPLPREFAMQKYNIPTPGVVEAFSQVTTASYNLVMTFLDEKMNDGVFMCHNRLSPEKAKAYSDFTVFQFSVCDELPKEVQDLVIASLGAHGWAAKFEATQSQHSPNVTITLFAKDMSTRHG